MSQHSKSLAGWIAYLRQADIPVLKSSARELERLRADDLCSTRAALPTW